MLQKALNLIRGLAMEAKNKGITLLPQLFPMLKRGIDKTHSLLAPDDLSTGTLEKGITLAHQFLVRPSPNASFGVGTWGPYEPSPAFIGDIQEQAENYERIMKNPNRKLLVLPKQRNTKKTKKTQARKPIKKKNKKRKKYKAII